jgi:hypothetical protein
MRALRGATVQQAAACGITYAGGGFTLGGGIIAAVGRAALEGR